MDERLVFEEGRRRLLSVLWERLAELEADATREALWRRTNWDTITGLECSACHRIVFHQLVGGRCQHCNKVNSESLRMGRQRLSELGRRYPKLVSGLRAKLRSLGG